MTKAEAKEISLEVWGYLAEHPECDHKRKVPDDIYSKIKDCDSECPLCEMYSENICRGCVLDAAGEGCFNIDSAWYKWWIDAPLEEEGNEARAAAAKRIVSIIEAWDTGEEEEK
jgi:hypothetical protein